MSIRLLWHTFVYPDGTPGAGLCRKDNEELVFVVEYKNSYKESSFTSYRPSKDDLQRLQNEQQALRDVIGGFKDYGEAFKERKQMTSVFITKSVQLPLIEEMERVETFSYSDIINPYQHNL